MKRAISSEEALAEFATQFIAGCQAPCVIYLQGDLGVGKTTFTRKLLRALNFSGPIKSPTYTLIESYSTARLLVQHLDLYRINDPEELAFLGIEELMAQSALFIIEWPEMGEGFLPSPDVVIQFAFDGDGRLLSLQATSPTGQAILDWL